MCSCPHSIPAQLHWSALPVSPVVIYLTEADTWNQTVCGLLRFVYFTLSLHFVSSYILLCPWASWDTDAPLHLNTNALNLWICSHFGWNIYQYWDRRPGGNCCVMWAGLDALRKRSHTYTKCSVWVIDWLELCDCGGVKWCQLRLGLYWITFSGPAESTFCVWCSVF